MKRNRFFLLLLVCFFGFLTGCSKMHNISESIGSEINLLDKVVFEKNRGDCAETMAIYFKGDNITKVEVKETYSNQDAASNAYKSYLESSYYDNLRSSEFDIGYEYSSSYIYNTFEGIRGKDKIVNFLQKEREYVLR